MVTGDTVAPGTSGGITLVGTFGALGGAVAIGILAGVGITLGWAPGAVPAFAVAAIVTGGGLSAALLDSVLGATVQAMFHCRGCREETESAVHRCGQPAILVRGIPGVTNDGVNLLATLAGGGLAGLAAWIA